VSGDHAATLCVRAKKKQNDARRARTGPVKLISKGETGGGLGRSSSINGQFCAVRFWGVEQWDRKKNDVRAIREEAYWAGHRSTKNPSREKDERSDVRENSVDFAL